MMMMMTMTSGRLCLLLESSADRYFPPSPPLGRPLGPRWRPEKARPGGDDGEQMVDDDLLGSDEHHLTVTETLD